MAADKKPTVLDDRKHAELQPGDERKFSEMLTGGALPHVQSMLPDILDDETFRRLAGLAVLFGWTVRFGGFNETDRHAYMPTLWGIADDFMGAEHKKLEPLPVTNTAVKSTQRAARPGDEWGVRDVQGKLHRGFVTCVEAEEAAKHRYPGGTVVQLAGTGAMTAPAFA